VWLLVLGILAVFGIAFIYSNLGMGGGVLFVPLLFWLTGYPEDQVVVISLCLVMANSLTALSNHQREKLVDWKLGAVLSVGAIAGALIGAKFNLMTGKDVFLLIFLAVVIAVIIKMLIDWARDTQFCEADDDGKMTGRNLVLASCGTLGGGFMAGCLGLGGGVINVPIMMYLLGRCTKRSAGTSFVIMIVASIVSLVAYWAGGTEFDMMYVLALAPVVFLGSFIGSRWGIKRLRGRQVQLLFILVLALAIVKAGYDFIGLT
jgi:hypothetical protein